MEKPFVFVHITDIHLQKRSADSSYLNFRHFVQDVLPVINPSLVINTGDITQSQEYDRKKILDHDEWMLYSSVLKENGWFDERKWLDVRGNHDTFVQYGGIHPYKQHTVYGSSGKGSVYSSVYHTDSGDIQFIGIDANGPLYRHFNGFLFTKMLDSLESLLEESTMPTILFSHYPIFTIDQRAKSTKGHSLQDLIRIYKPMYYLCGHMHSALGGMITRHHETIEAEQFDFKTAHQFRIYSFFNNELSFTTYNLNIDESPIVIIHSPVDMRYETHTHRKDTNLIFFSIVNVEDPQVVLLVDHVDFSHHPGVHMIKEDGQTHLYFRPALKTGKHDFQCIITNTQSSKVTVAQRAFNVLGDDADSISGLNNCPSASPLSHVALEQGLSQMYHPFNVEYALEYPTSSKVGLVMRVDWSRLMLVMNPLIIVIIILAYWGCRQIAFSILRKQTDKVISTTLNFSSWDWFFATDRNMKFSLFNSYFAHLPSWLRFLLSRLFLFTSDNLIYYGVLLAIFCRNLLPRFYRDEKNYWSCFSIVGYHNYHTKETYPYMDTYVFGSSFFYVMMIVFTFYMFLFASPSVYKNCPYNILSYLLMMVDVVLMVLFYKYSIDGKRRKNMRTLLSLLLQLTDSFSLVILLVLMIREKMI